MQAINNTIKITYSCQFCKKEFVKESTLESHVCESKRRHLEIDDRGVQLGFRAFLRFFEVAAKSSRTKNYSDFVSSPYYRAFVKFGKYIIGVKAIVCNNHRQNQCLGSVQLRLGARVFKQTVCGTRVNGVVIY